MTFKYGDRVVVHYSSYKLKGVIAGVIGGTCTVILDDEYISLDNGKFKAVVAFLEQIRAEDKTKVYGGFYSQEDLITGKTTKEVLLRNGFKSSFTSRTIYYRDGSAYWHAQRPQQVGPIWLEYFLE